MGNFNSSLNRTCIFLKFGCKPQYLQKTFFHLYYSILYGLSIFNWNLWEYWYIDTMETIPRLLRLTLVRRWTAKPSQNLKRVTHLSINCLGQGMREGRVGKGSNDNVRYSSYSESWSYKDKKSEFSFWVPCQYQTNIQRLDGVNILDKIDTVDKGCETEPKYMYDSLIVQEKLCPNILTFILKGGLKTKNRMQHQHF